MSSDRTQRISKATPVQLGPLEMAVLGALWQAGPQRVAGVHERVGVPRRLAPNTIHSTLERLVRKRLAARRRVGRAYEYRALVSRAEWIAHAMSAVLDAVPGDDPAHMLAGFVELAERSGAKTLEELERIVAQRRRALDEEAGS